ncbi:MAG: energy transducer TonB [Desulfuromonadales bacterium]|nr:energy transducer TonB [Desulfuromonadales bacterium]
MMTNLPPVFRLTIFLLLSLGLHGGLAFYEWSNDSDASGVVAAPVAVSLLPAAKPMQRITASKPESVPALSRKPSRPKVKPKVVPLVEKIKKAPVKKNPNAKIVEKIVVDPPAPELVCPTPQKETEGSPVAVAAASVPVEEPVLVASLVTGDLQVVNQASSSASSLVEATPHYRSNPLPEYPRLARKKHWEGVVWLLVDVSVDGSVDDLEVEKTCGHKILDRAAQRTVKRWQFSPATRGGLPVSSQVRIPVRFRLEEG